MIDVFGDGSHLISRAKANKVLNAYKNLVDMADFYDMDIDIDAVKLIKYKPAPKRTWLDNYLDKDSDRNAVDWQGYDE